MIGLWGFMLRLSRLVWRALLKVSSLLSLKILFSVTKTKSSWQAAFLFPTMWELAICMHRNGVWVLLSWPRSPLPTRFGQSKVVDGVMLRLLQYCKFRLFLLGRSHVFLLLIIWMDHSTMGFYLETERKLFGWVTWNKYRLYKLHHHAPFKVSLIASSPVLGQNLLPSFSIGYLIPNMCSYWPISTSKLFNPGISYGNFDSFRLYSSTRFSPSPYA